MILAYLDGIIKPKQKSKNCRTNNKPKIDRKLSNRKLKKKKYADFQRLYKKKRKSAFDSLFTNNSIDDSLNQDQVFDYWSHLLCRKSVKFVDQPIQASNIISFDPTLLVYPRKIKGCQGKKQSAAGLDGLTVRDVNQIRIRCKCKLFTLFLHMHWIPDILLNSITIFTPKKSKVNSHGFLTIAVNFFELNSSIPQSLS